MLTWGLVLASLVAVMAVATASSQPSGNPTPKTRSYVNPTGLPAARAGKFPFPAGSVIVKEAFENQGCRPGGREPCS